MRHAKCTQANRIHTPGWEISEKFVAYFKTKPNKLDFKAEHKVFIAYGFTALANARLLAENQSER